MDLVQLEKKYGGFYAPAFEIELDGTDLVREGMEIASVSVDNSLDEADHFTFTVDNAFDPVKGELKWIDTFLPAGKTVKIRIGYAGRLELLMAGIITSITADFPSGGAPKLEVSGLDLSCLLMKETKSRSWDDATHSDAVSRIALDYGRFGLKGNVENTGVVYPKQMKPSGQSDYQYIQTLAQRNFFEFFVFGETLHFRSPKIASEPAVTLRWNESLIRFQPEINLIGQVSEVEVRGWDPRAKREIVGTARAGDELGARSGAGERSGSELIRALSADTVKEQLRFPVYSQQEADQLAKSILNKHAEGLVKGIGETIGIPDILPGKTIRLEGLGPKFSKTYYVERTVHSIGGSGYQTTFHVKENAI